MAPVVKSDQKGKSKASGVISVLDISELSFSVEG
jgi:hypothetical protein